MTIAGKWLASLVLGAVAAVACSSSKSAPTNSAAPQSASASKASAFGSGLSLALTVGNAPKAGDKSMSVDFALTNNGSATFDGCFGQAWGISLIVGGNDAGHVVRADYPKCEEKLTLLPHQTITWSKKVPLTNLRGGPAKLTGWVRIVDPKACNRSYGCHDVSVASALQKLTVGER